MSLTEKEINEAFEKCNRGNQRVKTMELTDTVDFECQHCGKCCIGNTKTILSPFDLYSIAKHKNVKPFDFINDYCIAYIGDTSGIPIIILKEDERHMCPLLELDLSKGKFHCSLSDEDKPGSCSLFPFGIVKNIDKNDITKVSEQFVYTGKCGGCKQTGQLRTVQDIIKPYLKYKKEHEESGLLMTLINQYIDTEKFCKCIYNNDVNFIKNSNKISDKERDFLDRMGDLARKSLVNIYFHMMVNVLYDVDINKSFLEQLDGIKNRIKTACIDFIAISTLNTPLDLANADFKAVNLEEIQKKCDEQTKFKDQFVNDMLNGGIQ